MEWNRILQEYEQSRSRISRKIGEETNEEKKEMLREMYEQLTEDIRSVRKNSLDELQIFLDQYGEELLTPRQMQVLTLRARGLSMSRIGTELGISKTAVQKSIRLSEKKIRDFSEGRGGVAAYVS